MRLVTTLVGLASGVAVLFDVGCIGIYPFGYKLYLSLVILFGLNLDLNLFSVSFNP